MPVQYIVIFHACKNDDLIFKMKTFDNFLIIAQNKDCGVLVRTASEAVLCIHNLCFMAKFREKCIPQ